MYVSRNVECLCRAKCSKRQLGAHKLKVNGFYKRNACVSSKASVNSLRRFALFSSRFRTAFLSLNRSSIGSAQWVHDTDSLHTAVVVVIIVDRRIPVRCSSVFVALSGDVFVVSFDFRWDICCFHVWYAKQKHSHGSQMHSKSMAHRFNSSTYTPRWSNLNLLHYFWLKTLLFFSVFWS